MAERKDAAQESSGIHIVMRAVVYGADETGLRVKQQLRVKSPDCSAANENG
jgi:hypothetical protein